MLVAYLKNLENQVKSSKTSWYLCIFILYCVLLYHIKLHKLILKPKFLYIPSLQFDLSVGINMMLMFLVNKLFSSPPFVWNVFYKYIQKTVFDHQIKNTLVCVCVLFSECVHSHLGRAWGSIFKIQNTMHFQLINLCFTVDIYRKYNCDRSHHSNFSTSLFYRANWHIVWWNILHWQLLILYAI